MSQLPSEAPAPLIVRSSKVAKIASQASVYSLNGATRQENTGAGTWVLYGTTAVAPSSLAEVTDVTE